MGLADIVNVQITRETKSISRAGFGTALILSSTVPFSGVREYASAKAALEDMPSSEAAYKLVQSLFSQERRPLKVLVGKRAAKVAQVTKFVVQNNTPGQFIVTINGTDVTFVATTETIAQIRTALTGLINTQFGPVVTAVDGAPAGELNVTADVAGTGFSAGASANIVVTATTPNAGIVEDITAADLVNDSWYMLMLTSRSSDDILNAAAVIESQRRMFAACTADAGVITGSTTDVASQLKALAYDRTFILYSGSQATGPEAGWVGGTIPYDPGSVTWKFKTIKGSTPDKLTGTQESNLKTKNANYYSTVAGVGIAQHGKVASGEWIDTIHFLDWQQAQIEEAVFGALIGAPKIPYTDNGVAVIEAQVKAALQRGVIAGGLSDDPAPTTTVGKVADQATQDRQDRYFPDIEFDGVLAGAIHSTRIQGTVSV